MTLRALPALLAVAVLAGCGAASGSPAAAPATTRGASCHQQYEVWKHGPARQAGTVLAADLRRARSAGDAMDLPKLAAALKRAGRAATHLAALPIPRCADPAGYYGPMLAHVTAAGDNARSASGLAAVILAEVPLKGFGAAERKLNAELDRTVGKSR